MLLSLLHNLQRMKCGVRQQRCVPGVLTPRLVLLCHGGLPARLSLQTHCSLCLRVGGAGGWQGWGGRVSHSCQSPDHTTAMPHCCFYLSCLVPWLLSLLLSDANSLLLSQGVSAPLQGCPV